MKLSASAIWHNLHYPNGTAIIPDNSFVYIATDDPDGVCKECLFQKRPCDSYGTPKPVGCPEDVSYMRICVYLLVCVYISICVVMYVNTRVLCIYIYLYIAVLLYAIYTIAHISCELALVL